MPPAKPFDEWFLQFIKVHKAFCAGCGYQLNGITELRCPECGDRVDIESTMGRVDPRSHHHEDRPIVTNWIGCLGVVLASFVVIAVVLSLY